MSSTDDLYRAKSKAQRFQEEIQRYVKRHNPVHLAICLATKIDQVCSNRNRLMAGWPVHFLIHAIEAGCAYYRDSYNDPITDKTLLKIVNVYHEYYSPMNEYLLKNTRRMDLFLAMTARQQFYLQETAGEFDAARGLVLFNEANFPTTSELCRRELGFGFKDWFTFCFVLWAGLLDRTPPIISADYFRGGGESLIDRESIRRLFQQLSTDVDGIGQTYRRTRDRHGYLYDPYFQSIFATRPLLDLGHGNYLAPHKGLILETAVQGLFDLGKTRWTKQFGLEFGSAFEKYVGRVLAELPNVRVYSEEEIRKHTFKRVCDYIVVGEQFVLCLECKAVGYSAVLTSEGAVRGDNSTTKIATAIDQITSVAQQALYHELFDLIGSIEGRRVLGIVVTFRHVYMANLEEYWKNAILPHLKSSEDQPTIFAHRPQIFDVSELEQLVLLACQSGSSLADVFESKLTHSIYQVGEWQTWLGTQLNEGGSLSILNGVFEEFTDGIVEVMSASESGGDVGDHVFDET